MNDGNTPAMMAAAVALACALATPAVHAADSTAFVDAIVGNASNSGVGGSDGASRHLGVGYRWAVAPSVALGIEAGYGDFAHALSGYATIVDGTTSRAYRLDFDAHGPTLGLDARFDVAPAWAVDARVGVQRVSYSVHPRLAAIDGADTAWYAGIGVARDFGRDFSIGVRYDRERIGLDRGAAIDSDQFGIRAEYRFGSR